MENCQQIQNQLIDYLTNNIDRKSKEIIEKHLVNCQECHNKLEELKHVFNELDNIPKESFSNEFENQTRMLLIQQAQNQNKSKKVLTLSFSNIAASIIILIIGGAAGFLINSNINLRNQLISAQREVLKLEKKAELSILMETSASEKLNAITYLQQFDRNDNEFIDALFNRLISDDNPNVRLAALKAIEPEKENTEIQTMLIESLNYQKDPLVQIYLIDILLKSKQKEAIEALRKILENHNTNAEVKQYTSDALSELKL